MARSQAPAVLDGMRAPRSVRLEDIRAHGAMADEPRAVVESGDGTVYVSTYRRYRVQVTAPRSFTDPLGIKQAAGTMIVAVFDEGVYRNNHRDLETRALIDRVLQSNPHFGAFGSGAHFWLASDQNARMEKARVASALNTLRSLPKDAVEKFVADLKAGNAEDHELPPAPVEGGRTARPIPPQQ